MLEVLTALSLQSKVILIAGITAILITQIHTFDSNHLFVSLLGYIMLAYNANCLVGGGCGAWSWATSIVPVVVTIIYIYHRSFGSSKDEEIQLNIDAIEG